MVKAFFLLVVFTAFSVLFFTRSRQTVSPGFTPTPTTQEKHPYSLDNLTTHIDTNGKITDEKLLSVQPKFTSHLVSYSSEGMKQYALMNVPSGTAPTNGWPVVIVNHGYIPPQQYSTINSYPNTSAYYANSGFLVLKPDYRGHDRSEGESVRPLSRLQYAVDVLNLLAALSSLPQANQNQVFMYGHSMGGEVSLLVAEVSSVVKGVSLWAPAVHSFPYSVTYFTSRNRPTPTDYQQTETLIDQLLSQYPANQFTSIDNLSRIQVPLIIHHGTADLSVPLEWSTILHRKLLDNGKNSTLYTYPDDNHDISSNWSKVLNRDISFFRSLI